MNNLVILDGLRAKVLLILCCILCYAGSVRNEYALDDDFSFYANQYVQKGISGIPGILTHAYYSDRNRSFDYRPVAGITFAVEKQLFGNDPHIGHFFNLLFYMALVLLIFQLLTAVFNLEILPSLLISLFFAIHPSHVEVVASIKNREELLSMLFAVLTLIYAHKVFESKTSGSRFISALLIVIFLLLSFASKMTNITIIPIIVLSLYFKGYHRRKALFYSLVGFIAVFATLYTGRLYLLLNRPIFNMENPLVDVTDLSAKIGTGMVSLWFYFRFMLVPYPFSFFYGYNTIPVVHLDEPVAVLSVFIHLGLFIYGSVLFFQKKTNGFFILAYFISISVYSNLIMLYTGIVSERALFSPSLWFIAAVSLSIYSWIRELDQYDWLKRSALALVLSGFLVYGVLTINRTRQWHDNLTLMRSDVSHLQNSTLANYFYANVLKAKGEQEPDTAVQNTYLNEAKKYYYLTNSISPTFPSGYFRLGLIYRYDRLVPDSAYYYFKKAYTINQSLTEVEYQYGRIEYELGDPKISSDVFTKLYQQLPDDTFTVFYHALLLMKTGHPEDGHKVNALFMKMAPGYYQPYFNEGLYYQIVGDSANAVRNYEASIQLGCTDQTVYKYLLNYYQGLGRIYYANRYLRLLHE